MSETDIADLVNPNRERQNNIRRHVINNVRKMDEIIFSITSQKTQA